MAYAKKDKRGRIFTLLIRPMIVESYTQIGILKIGEATIPVYRTKSALIGVCQASVYRYLSYWKKPLSKYQLLSSNLGKYLPKAIFSNEFAVEAPVKPIRIFSVPQLLALCRAILRTEQDGKLGDNWKSAPSRVQVLLLLVAEHGMYKILEKVLRDNPGKPTNTFETYLTQLLTHNTIQATSS